MTVVRDRGDYSQTAGLRLLSLPAQELLVPRSSMQRADLVHVRGGRGANTRIAGTADALASPTETHALEPRT